MFTVWQQSSGNGWGASRASLLEAPSVFPLWKFPWFKSLWWLNAFGWSEESKEVEIWKMNGKRCLLINSWIQMENHCLNFFQIFIGPNWSPVERFNFVAGLDLTLNCETAIKLCFSKAYLNAQACVEKWGYRSLSCVFLFPLPFLHPLPSDLLIPTEKLLYNRKTSKQQTQGGWWW